MRFLLPTRSRSFVVLAVLIMLWPGCLAVSGDFAQLDKDPFASEPGPPGGETAGSLVGVRLAADASRIAPGQEFHIAVIFDITEHWHIYWQNAGDAGSPTEIEITAPEGFKVGKPVFPRPKAIEGPVGVTYGHEERAVLFVPVTAPENLVDGEAVFLVDVYYFVCRERCLTGQSKQTLRLETTAADENADAPDAALIAEHRDRLPKPIEDLTSADVQFDGEQLIITGPAQGHLKFELFPVPEPGVKFAGLDVVVQDDRFRITVEIDVRPRNFSRKSSDRPSVRGVIGFGVEVDDPCYHFDLPLAIDEGR